MRMKKYPITTLLVLFVNIQMSGQITDKADADLIIFQELSTPHTVENWHPDLIILDSKLSETSEEGVFVLRGDTFQIRSLTSDVYLRQCERQWLPIFDSRYPLESFANLLLNHVHDNRHRLQLRHHQYGGNTPTLVIPMQTLYDILARPLRLYCSVTYITTDEMKAVLVFHQQRLNFIHMLEVHVPTKDLFVPESTLTADLYTNIPQGNVHNIFTERK